MRLRQAGKRSAGLNTCVDLMQRRFQRQNGVNHAAVEFGGQEVTVAFINEMAYLGDSIVLDGCVGEGAARKVK